jgi:RND family efflux transporter MFP subunit
MAEAARDEAARHATRMDTLYTQDAVPMVQRDQARLGLVQAEAQVTLAEAALQDVATAAGYAALRAPFAGMVVSRAAAVGDLAAPGMPLVGIAADGPREVVLGVPPEVAAGLMLGQDIVVQSDVAGEAVAPIRAVASGADPMTRTVEVRAELPPTWPTGVAVTALVPAGVREGIAIPESAVVRRGQLTGVRVVSEQGEALRWIRLGRRLDAASEGSAEARVEVLSGLEPGERIGL